MVKAILNKERSILDESSTSYKEIIQHAVVNGLYGFNGGSEIYLDRKYLKFLEVEEIHLCRILRKQQKDLEKLLIKKDKESKKQKEENLVISLLDEGYSIRQIMIQYGIDKRKTRKIIEEKEYPYGSRRRMFSVDPNRGKTP